MNENNVLWLNKDELEKQIQEVVSFLDFVHPGLRDGTYESRKSCVELRPISREGYNYALSRSLNLWNLNDASMARLRDFLAIHNGAKYCLYYSVFAFDYNKAHTITPTGQKRKKGKVNSEAALFHNEIVLDFDNLPRSEFHHLYDRFAELELDGLWVYTGHGIQVHLKLDELCFDRTVLKKLVYKFRSKGFDCDEACVDAARVMRLPFTYNCKCFAEEKYSSECEAPPFCEVLHRNDAEYSADVLFKRLDQLPTVSKADEQVLYDLFAEPASVDPVNGILPVPALSDVLEVQQIVYPYLSRW